jgi:hypothetical protein
LSLCASSVRRTDQCHGRMPQLLSVPFVSRAGRERRDEVRPQRFILPLVPHMPWEMTEVIGLTGKD